MVLEFKDRGDLQEATRPLGRSARRYRNRLQKYHDESVGMRKWTVLIPTLSQGLCETPLKRLTVCSPDRLAEELKRQLGERPERVRSVSAWRTSSYSVH